MTPSTLQTPSSQAARLSGTLVATRRAGLSLRLSERKVLLYAADVTAICAALLIILTLRFRFPMSWQTIAAQPLWFGLLVGLWSVVAPLLNAYDLRAASRVASGVGRVAAVSLVVAAVYLSIPYITPALHASRLTAAGFVALMTVLPSIGRLAYARLLVQPTFRHRVLVVGAGWAGRSLIEAVRTHADTEYDLVGLIDDDLARHDEVIDGLAVLGTSQDLTRLAEAHDVSEVIIAITRHETMAGSLVAALMDCRERGIQVTVMQAVYERLTGRVPVEYAGKSLHLVLPADRDLNRVYLLLKRALDLLMGLAGTALTALLFPLVALALRLEGPGPILYRQARVGRGGQPFVLFKFRTMVPNAEAAGAQWAAVADRRVTRVGHVLRLLHLDEVPQCINLLKGEMSFIGPRPERPEFVGRLAREVPFYRARHAMRPGVTGWAQVNYRYGRSTADALMKLQYDLYYIKHCSLFLDTLILVRTLGMVLTLRNR
jgi:exopolysaccharide biosynthesis polyprenyl glycosylphosphotransferase